MGRRTVVAAGKNSGHAPDFIYVKRLIEMAISELETKRIEKLVGQFVEKKRPKPEIRPDLI